MLSLPLDAFAQQGGWSAWARKGDSSSHEKSTRSWSSKKKNSIVTETVWFSSDKDIQPGRVFDCCHTITSPGNGVTFGKGPVRANHGVKEQVQLQPSCCGVFSDEEETIWMEISR
jgi:hypothetical protein